MFKRKEGIKDEGQFIELSVILRIDVYAADHFFSSTFQKREVIYKPTFISILLDDANKPNAFGGDTCYFFMDAIDLFFFCSLINKEEFGCYFYNFIVLIAVSISLGQKLFCSCLN